MSQTSIQYPSPVREGQARAQYQRDFFVYTVGPLSVASGATATGSIQIQADATFLWEQLTYYATIANAAFTRDATPIPSVTVQIVDTASGKQLFSNPVAIPSIAGTGELPYPLTQPRYFRPSSQVSVVIANFDAAVAYNIRLNFIGAKIYDLSPNIGL